MFFIKAIAGKYYAQLAQDEEIYEKTRSSDERRRKNVSACMKNRKSLKSEK